MYKLYKLLESLQKILRKPLINAETRIFLNPIIRRFNDDDLEDDHNNYYLQYYKNQHRKYLRQLEINHRLQQRPDQFSDEGLEQLCNLYFQNAFLARGNQEMQNHRQVFFQGDYKTRNPRNFVHRMQYGRIGAEEEFFSLSDIETTVSYIPDLSEIQMEDSILVNN
ncbi:hypothetical protein pb186bvf_019313 [Paramecium bursaria]